MTCIEPSPDSLGSNVGSRENTPLMSLSLKIDTRGQTDVCARWGMECFVSTWVEIQAGQVTFGQTGTNAKS